MPAPSRPNPWVSEVDGTQDVRRPRLPEKRPPSTGCGKPCISVTAPFSGREFVTNLSTTEAYLLDPARAESLAKKHGLVAQERGYEVLLIEPYYRGVVERFKKDPEDPTWTAAMAILTFLDLYHFPLRGIEQAEAIYRKTPVLKTIAPWSALESIEPA